jgi:hypothetical protein
MKDLEYKLTDTERAHRALESANQLVASLFTKRPKEVRFVFLSYISGASRGEQIVGQCVHESNEIQLLARIGWQNTAIHELVHLYYTDGTEKEVKQITSKIIRYLKTWYKQ